MFAMRTTLLRLFLHELKNKLQSILIISKSVQGRQFIKILKFHNCIDFFQKFLNENMQTRNTYKLHDREISSHLFNILNGWSMRILLIFFFFFMLQRCSYRHIDIIFDLIFLSCMVYSYFADFFSFCRLQRCSYIYIYIFFLTQTYFIVEILTNGSATSFST